MYKILAGIIAIFITNAAMALDAEYKNTLTKIDLNKSSDSSYNINLYTSKEYSEPVKVVKKSDLNYYILLPETKNIMQNIQVNNSDIRSVETQLFPYAGADVKNGYTKININTTKPINFSVNTKMITASNPQKTLSKEDNKQEVKTAAVEAKVQKKNLVQEKQNQKSNSIVKQGAKTSQQKPIVTPKKEVKSKEIKPVVAAAKIVPEKAQTKKTEPKKVENVKLQAQKQLDETKEPISVDNIINQETKQFDAEEDLSQQNNKQLKEEINQALVEQKKLEEAQQQVEDSTKQKNNTSISSAILLVKDKVQNKLSEYGLTTREFLLMLVAGILSFVIMLLALTRGKEIDTRIRSKADFIDKKFNKNSTLVPKKNVQDKKTNQFFVFDKNVRQTGFIPPASEGKKNYELSSYEPSIQTRSTATIEPYQAKHVNSEYDIIQNILREDNFIELSEKDIEATVEQAVSTIPAKKEMPEIKPVSIPQKEQKDEPQVLSSVEIAPQRGFMCVSYNDSISLVGYIFDDVFAIYNFQQTKLENYNIKYRMSEKTDKGTNFIVKVDKTKMLVSVTKSSMNLEVAY